MALNPKARSRAVNSSPDLAKEDAYIKFKNAWLNSQRKVCQPLSHCVRRFVKDVARQHHK